MRPDYAPTHETEIELWRAACQQAEVRRIKILNGEVKCPHCHSENIKRVIPDMPLNPFRTCRDCETHFSIWALYVYPENPPFPGEENKEENNCCL